MLFVLGNISGGNRNLRENPCKPRQKSRLNSPKNHTCRWYDDTQPCKISCPNSTSFVRYKNNKFQARKLSRWLVRNLLFFITHKRNRVWTRYFTRLCIIISSTCAIFLVNLDDFFAVVCTGFHEVVVCTRYIPCLLLDLAAKNRFVEAGNMSAPTNIFVMAGHALAHPYKSICRGGWGHDPALQINF